MAKTKAKKETKAKKLAEKQVEKLQEEIENILSGGETDEESDGVTDFKSVVMDQDYSQQHEDGKIGDHTYEFVRFGSTGGVDIPYGDGGDVEWIFKVDGHLFAVTGYYSSWDSTEITDTDWTQVKLSKKMIEYYEVL